MISRTGFANELAKRWVTFVLSHFAQCERILRPVGVDD